jgi:small lipoprotein (TIGR04452 family)
MQISESARKMNKKIYKIRNFYKIFCLIIFLNAMTKCIILDNIGLNVVHEVIKGSEAKNMITTNAILGGLAYGATINEITGNIASKTQTFKSEKFYDRKDVNRCIESALLYSPTFLFGGADACTRMSPDATFIDWPIKLF